MTFQTRLQTFLHGSSSLAPLSKAKCLQPHLIQDAGAPDLPALRVDAAQLGDDLLGSRAREGQLAHAPHRIGCQILSLLASSLLLSLQPCGCPSAHSRQGMCYARLSVRP